MSRVRLLIDKSAFARLHVPAVRTELEGAVRRGEVGTCTVTELEILYSARNQQDFERLRRLLQAFPSLPLDQAICDRALVVQQGLVATGQHRGPSIPDLLIAATAERHDVAVVHHDRDFDVIATVTGQRMQWVVRRDRSTDRPRSTGLPPLLRNPPAIVGGGSQQTGGPGKCRSGSSPPP